MAKLKLLSLSGWLRKERRTNESAVVVVIYHRVGSGTDSFLDVPASAFRSQLDYLQDHYRILSLDGAIQTISAANSHERIAVLTFDDGYQDFYTTALPELVRRGLPATLYLATGYAGGERRFPWDARYNAKEWPEVRPLGWRELEDVARLKLIAIECHSHDHLRLDRAVRSVIEQDIATSVTTIRDRFGVEPRHFACPFGAYSEQLGELCRQRFRTVAVAGWRPNLGSVADWRRVMRIPAVPSSDVSLFASALAGNGSILETLSRVKLKLTG